MHRVKLTCRGRGQYNHGQARGALSLCGARTRAFRPGVTEQPGQSFPLTGGSGQRRVVAIAAVVRPVTADFRPNLDQANPRRFQPFAALDNIDDDLLAFAEAREPRSLKSGDVDEHVLSATIAGDEAEPLLGVEPLHRAGLLDGYA